MKYQTFAALAEESNSGWVWLGETGELKSRLIVKIVHNGHKVFCECRTIDGNFCNLYNHPPRISISGNPKKALVISQWYRSALGGIETQQEVDLDITPAKIPFWRAIRAAAHHPDLLTRLFTYLGVIAVWSVAFTLLASFLPANSVVFCAGPRVISFIFALLFGAVCISACWPVRR
jgi:hypothetical protein